MMEDLEASRRIAATAYQQAFEELGRSATEAVEAGNAPQAWNTWDGMERIKVKREATEAAVENWQQATADLRLAYGHEG
jgi:hypothetical protein